MRRLLPSFAVAVAVGAVALAPLPAAAEATGPSAPQNVSARAGVNEATVTWEAPSDRGGSPTLNYTVTSSPGAKTCSGLSNALSCIVPGLSNGQAYTFTVVATGDGLASEPSAPSAPVTPQNDTRAPVLVSSTVTPGRVSSLGGTLQVDLRITDDISGRRTPSGGFDANPAILFKDSAGTSFGFTRPSTRISGDKHDGIYRYTVTVPSGTRAGAAKLTVYPIDDNAGNSTFFIDRPGVLVGSPAAPENVTATATANRDAQVTWAAPTDDGGNAISGYTVTEAPSGRIFATTTETHVDVPLTDHPAESALTYSVTATNVAGTSPAAQSAPLSIPANVPSAPAKPSTTAGDQQIAVTWTPTPGNGAAVFTYTATAAPGGSTCAADGAGTGCAIEGLTNGTEYSVTVTAANAVGTSEASPASDAATPRAVPDRVHQPSAIAGPGQAILTWEPSAPNGTPITGYTATATPGGQTCTAASSASTCTVAGLANGTSYTFSVQANSAAGPSEPSIASTPVTPADVPDQPSQPTVTRGDQHLTVTWPATEANGSTISDYTAVASPGGARCSTVNTSCVIEGLTNGSGYTVVVTATNSVGTSSPSAASAETTPAAAPEQMIAPTAKAGAAAVTVAWDTATANGTVVTGYKVTAAPGGRTCTAAATSRSCVVTGLANGVTHTFTVVANSAAGSSTASLPSSAVKPIDKPSQVSKPAAKAGTRSATVTWRAPRSNGSTITGYVVRASNGKTVRVSSSKRSVKVTGLKKGRKYTFKVAAKNAAGQGAYSTSSSSVKVR